MKKIAHKNENGEQNLFNHLNNVSKLCSEFCYKFGYKEIGEVLGLEHDFGKYKPKFQEYINGKRNKSDETQHAISGAILLNNYCNNSFDKSSYEYYSKLFVYPISGHHIGLENWNNNTNIGLKDKLINQKHYNDALSGNPPEEILKIQFTPTQIEIKENFHFIIRFLFSSLVDADFLDTERFMNLQLSNLRKNENYSIKKLSKSFYSYLHLKIKNSEKSMINIFRKNILQNCLKSASKNENIFTLTVPTGGGKTLSSMGFALNHALKFKKDRIIIVIPYTSIIEQTSEELKKIFGIENVIEHHSNFDFEKIENDKLKKQIELSCENWDAPIIVTTNVQFFESLFSNKTSKCRKLHNIINSVIIFDEVQMLPTEFLKPILQSLNSLVDRFDCSIVLSTATKPTLTNRIGSAVNGIDGLKHSIEIIDKPEESFKKLERVNLNFIGKVTIKNLAAILEQQDQALCIVNTKKSCKNLYNELKSDCFHLSTSMCAEHRSDIIKEVKLRLREGKNVKLISTQLIEAGVDIDFPVVYRSLAGFDSIAQSAGRCNREGKLNKGQVNVFELNLNEEYVKSTLIQKGQIATKSLQTKELMPYCFNKYFNNFYSNINNFDEKNICRDLLTITPNFKTASENFKLINEANEKIVINYKNSMNIINEIIQNGINRQIMRKLQRFIINVTQGVFDKLKADDKIEEIVIDGQPISLWIQKDITIYNNKIGINI